VERTLVICKPDAVERGLIGEVVSRIVRRGLRLVAAELRTISKEVAEVHYAEHQGKPFFEGLVAFITRSPVMLLVVEGPDGVHRVIRTMMGATDPAQAAPGTVRGDLAIEMGENVIHGSDSPESATREIEIFFPGLD
jgi:nucleoside-diphosphate kinase